MKAVVSRGIGQVTVEDVDVPVPGPGEVLVRVVAAGICHTDLSVVKGNFDVPRPVVLGHEGCGYVDTVGPGVSGLGVGDAVICSIVMPCNACPQCARGAYSVCDRWFQVAFSGVMPDGSSRLSQDGSALNSFFCQSSFAEYAVVPASAAIRVRPDAPLEKLAALGCGVSTGLGAAIVRKPVEPGMSVAVLGAGGVGLATMLGAQAGSALKVIAVDLVPEKLERALKIGAATHAVQAGPNMTDDIHELTGGGGVDVFFDAVGASHTMENAIDATRNGGWVVAIGIMHNDLNYQVPLRALINEKVVTGTNGGSIVPQRDIPRFVDLMMAGRLPFDQITDRIYSIDDIRQAFDDLEHHRMTRGAIVFDSDAVPRV